MTAACVAAVFAGVSIFTGKMVDHCTATYLAVAGLVPVAGEAGIAACAGVTGIWAISTFIAGAVGTGGWLYDSGSASANAKRDYWDSSYILNGTGFKVHINKDVHTEFDELFETHCPNTKHLVRHVAKYSNVNVSAENTLYNFISETKYGNISTIAGAECIIYALNVHETCFPGGSCTAPNVTLAKRDDNSCWTSYTDWGTNQGYDQDYENWNYGYLVANNYAEKLGNNIVSQTQQCANSDLCYAIDNKYCLAAGYSDTRTDDSVAAGEVYNNAYGAVDGECYNG